MTRVAFCGTWGGVEACACSQVPIRWVQSLGLTQCFREEPHTCTHSIYVILKLFPNAGTALAQMRVSKQRPGRADCKNVHRGPGAVTPPGVIPSPQEERQVPGQGEPRWRCRLPSHVLSAASDTRLWSRAVTDHWTLVLLC